MTGERQRRLCKGRGDRRRRRRVERAYCICMIVATLAVVMGTGFISLLCYQGAEGPVMAGQAGGLGNREADRQDGIPREEDLKYPDSLLTLMEMNPEAEEFVLEYFQNKDLHPEIDLSGEVERGSIPLFLQWDKRCGYENYGSDFLAVTGCGPTCLSMVWCGLTGETQWDPLAVAGYAEREGYYVKGAGTAWDLMSMGAEELGLTVDSVVFDGQHILERLQAGEPIICAMRPGDFTTTGHFIVLSGLDGDGRVQVCDPNSRINSEKSWDVEELLPQIKNLWAYRYDRKLNYRFNDKRPRACYSIHIGTEEQAHTAI